MKFFINILEKLGIIPQMEAAKNQPCYDKYGRFLGWYSRSVAVAIFIFCKGEDGRWYVLASKRGKEAADFQGYWNSTCGYLDYGETAKEAAMRETLEETGVNLKEQGEEKSIKFVGYEDTPTANRQNITLRFCCFITDKQISDFVFSREGNEGEEVEEIKWVSIEDIDNYSWAFNHDNRIKEIFKKFVPKQKKS